MIDTVITCHRNADFDAASALVGASFLYPDAVLVFPGTQERPLQKFYEDAMRPLYDFRAMKDLDLSAVRRLVLVDTRQRDRLAHVEALLDRPDVEIHAWDHHRDQGVMVEAAVLRLAEVGSTCTLLAEELRARGIVPGCEAATVIGLGVYGDTGSFTYSSSTPRDFEAAAWLLKQGMDVGLIGGLVRHDLTREQIRALNELLENAILHDTGEGLLAIASISVDEYLNDFAMLAPRFIELQPCSIFFGLGAMQDKIQVVARSDPGGVDVGAICALLGGGGHPYAAAAVVKDKTLAELRDFILAQVSIRAHPDKTAGRLMSAPVIGVEEDDSILRAESTMARYGLKALPVFRGRSRVCLGLLEHQLAVKAISHGLGAVSVAAYMQRQFQVVTRAAGLQTLMDIIVGSRQRIVPVVEALPEALDDAPGKGATDGADVNGDAVYSGSSSPHVSEPAPETSLAGRPVVGVVTRTDLIRFFSEGEASLPKPRQRARDRNLAKVMRARVPAPGLDLLVRAGRLGAHMGVNVYVVGGFVRDLLMEQRGRDWPHMDLDLVVEGDGIAFARALAGELGGRVREHREFLTALVLFPPSALSGGTGGSGGAPETAQGEEELRIDIATARLEYYTSPAALPTVELSSIRMDLYRRDFTINAMAIQLNGELFGQLVDFFDGQTDIRQKRIRMLHALSFVEDPTRALRAVRFEQRYQFRIGPQCDRLIRNALELRLMDKLSGSRIVNELELMLDEPRPLACFARMQEFELLAAIHPQLDLPPWKVETLDRVLRATEWYRRLYLPEKADAFFLFLLAMCRTTPTPDIESLLARLDLPEVRRSALLDLRFVLIDAIPAVEAWHEEGGPQSRLHAILAPVPLEGLIYLVARLDRPDRPALGSTLSRYIYQGRLEKADVTGADLRDMGLPPGPLYGRILREVLAAKLDGLAPTREAQYELALGLARAYASLPLDGPHGSCGGGAT